MTNRTLLFGWVGLLQITALAVAAPPTTLPVGKLPHLTVDVPHHQVRIECSAVKADYPLEFLAVLVNTNEYESLLSTQAKPSDVHLALLLLGLKPGEPMHYIESTKTWLPPSGPPVQIEFDYVKDGQPRHVPAYRWMRDVHTKKEASPMTWVFTGSRLMDDGTYAGDSAGYLVSVINNELAVLDVPALKSRAIEARDYERNPDLMPPTGTPVTMVLSPAGAGILDAPAVPPAPRPQASTPLPGDSQPLSSVHIDQAKVDNLRAYWLAHVGPHRAALQEAAEAHYEVIAKLRQEQQRLVNESDRIQRTIDELEKEYQDMTTPRPETPPLAPASQP